MNIYKCFCKGKQPIDIIAENSRQAQLKAAQQWKVKSPYLITVVLMVKDDKPVTHSTTEF